MHNWNPTRFTRASAKRIRAVTPEQREEIVLRTARDYMHYASWFRDGAAEGEPEK